MADKGRPLRVGGREWESLGTGKISATKKFRSWELYARHSATRTVVNLRSARRNFIPSRRVRAANVAASPVIAAQSGGPIEGNPPLKEWNTPGAMHRIT